MSQSRFPAHLKAHNTAIISIDDAKNPHVRKGADYWRSLCGQRRFPARSDLTLRGMAAVLSHTVILRVIDDGADYEYRYVGDAQRQAYRVPFRGIRVTQIEAALPHLGAVLRYVYEQARSTGVPFAVRGKVNHEPPRARFLYHETVFLPLGASDAAVDHLLIVGVQVAEPFWAISTDKLTSLADQLRADGLPLKRAS